jgi:hypothetical protein
MIANELIGIDFSGDARQWRRANESNIWIATGRACGNKLHVTGLRPVQRLTGTDPPFDRLRAYLANASSSYAAIDAPFSVPCSITGDVEALWKRVLQLPTNGRPFAKGKTLVEALSPQLGPRGAKLLRLTEQYWKEKGVNVRSTMWAGPRGGAPFAAACMTLLAQHGGPIWPLRVDARRGCVLTEAFPAGQLRQWKQHHFGYNGAAAASLARRVSILNWMQQKRGLQIGAPDRNLCLRSADALDAVICMYSAAAVANNRLAVPPAELAAMEGLMAVHT